MIKSAITFLFLATSVTVAQSQISDLKGWCMVDDGCVGYIPLGSGSFDLCEESCTMTNPVSVRDMSATLYDVSCVSEESDSADRLMIYRVQDVEGQNRVWAVWRFGPEELQPCK